MTAAEAPSIGIVGGLGVGATIHYYKSLVAAHAARGISPELVFVHADLERVRPLVEAKAVDALADYLAGHIARLAGAGARIAVVPAIAPHICAPRLSVISPLPLVDIIDALNEELRFRGLRRVALMGTRYAMETALFGRLAGVEIASATPAETDFIHDVYMRLATTGAAGRDEVEALRGVALRLCAEEKAEAVVLAGTDLALVFDEENAGFPAIDAARVHVDAIMRRALGA